MPLVFVFRTAKAVIGCLVSSRRYVVVCFRFRLIALPSVSVQVCLRKFQLRVVEVNSWLLIQFESVREMVMGGHVVAIETVWTLFTEPSVRDNP